VAAPLPQKSKPNAEIARALDELVIESLRTLLPITTLIAWMWSVVIILFAHERTFQAYAVLAITIVSGVVSYGLRERRLNLAVGVYILGLMLTVTVIAAGHRDAASLYLYVLVVIVTATLAGARALWLVTAVCAGLIFIVAIASPAMNVSAWGLPVLLVLLTALAAWLSSRRLFTALAWTLNMTTESQKNAAEAQKHRGEVQRVLKNLDEAYVRLEHTNEALMFAREAAEKAYRFKSDFVANVSHELRTPLNLIIGFSEMMATAPESYGGVPLPREYRGDITAIYRSARHLSDLINDVLDLSQIEAGRMPINKQLTDLGEVVREAADIVRGLVEARGLRLEVIIPDHLPLIRLDRTRIRQVLLNLLTNATRFTDAGFIRARVRLSSANSPASNDAQSTQVEAMVTIEDSGRGISPDKLARAFEAFTQLHEDQIREGTGLGLAVSRRFVMLHGGHMWIESEEGRGTTVGFTLPVNEIQISEQKITRLQRSYHDEPIVLVLHDDPRALVLLRRYVEGYEFVMAPTIERANEVLQRAAPIAVIADTDWLERTTSTIADLSAAPAIPVLKAPLPGMRRTGILLGAVDYLAKPVTRETLAQALDRLDKPFTKVLVVDDDPHIVRLLGRMLKAEDSDLQVFEAFTGAEALQVAREQKPEVVLLDLLMPEVSGYDVLETMMKDSDLSETSVIIVSARGLDDETAPIKGTFVLERAQGFTTTEALRLVGATLSGAVGLN
jgi:signal transduction histidine kinase/DNA-binding response OmpR family regulator